MKTKSQITTSSEVHRTPTIYSACFLALFMLVSHIGKSQELAAATCKSTKMAVQANVVDTLNPAFAANEAKVDSIMSFYFRGTDDADYSYTGKKSGKWIIFGTSIIGTPVLGIIPAIISSSVCPSKRNLNLPDEALSHNPAYLKGYKDEAHDIKKKAIWGGFISGSGIWVAIANIVLI